MKNVNFDIEEIGLFRKAKASDIAENNTVYLVGDGDRLIKMNIDEVLSPNDEWKAFVSDGCRYGLFNLWCLKG